MAVTTIHKGVRPAVHVLSRVPSPCSSKPYLPTVWRQQPQIFSPCSLTRTLWKKLENLQISRGGWSTKKDYKLFQYDYLRLWVGLPAVISQPSFPVGTIGSSTSHCTEQVGINLYHLLHCLGGYRHNGLRCRHICYHLSSVLED